MEQKLVELSHIYYFSEWWSLFSNNRYLLIIMEGTQNSPLVSIHSSKDFTTNQSRPILAPLDPRSQHSSDSIALAPIAYNSLADYSSIGSQRNQTDTQFQSDVPSSQRDNSDWQKRPSDPAIWQTIRKYGSSSLSPTTAIGAATSLAGHLSSNTTLWSPGSSLSSPSTNVPSPNGGSTTSDIPVLPPIVSNTQSQSSYNIRQRFQQQSFESNVKSEDALCSTRVIPLPTSSTTSISPNSNNNLLSSHLSKSIQSSSSQISHSQAIEQARIATEYRRSIERIQENSSHIYYFVARYSPPLTSSSSRQSSNVASPQPPIPLMEEVLRRAKENVKFLQEWRDGLELEERGRNPSTSCAGISLGKDKKKAIEDEDAFIKSGTSKKRSRGMPSGRCHQCGISETPEWRRGPDGARTLCNACGLHHAKLIKKHGMMAANAAANQNSLVISAKKHQDSSATTREVPTANTGGTLETPDIKY
ncbi:hypothetical protein V1511DRAFT_488315 [Dipodascopsis uninucleata]